MKITVLSLIAGLLISFQSYAQKNEYRYPALKFGLINGFSPTPAFNENKYLYAPFGEMQLTPVSSAYVPGFVFDFLYHLDFNTDNAGIYTGIEYNYAGIGANYQTTYANDGFTMRETYRYHSVGVPLALQFGPKYVDSQGYVFFGAQINMILTMSAVQKTNIPNTSPSSVALASDAYNHAVFNLFFGVNYSAFNIQFDYYPNSFFNPDYVSEKGFRINTGQAKKSFALKTSVNIPYNWLSRRSYWWRKTLRETFWR